MKIKRLIVRSVKSELAPRVINATKEVAKGQKRFWAEKLKRRAEK